MLWFISAQKVIAKVYDYDLEVEASSAKEALAIAKKLSNDYEGEIVIDSSEAVTTSAEVANVKWYNKDNWKVSR